ncbi:ABC transporter substrate-binding protein [Hydrogenophaga sp.]|uniref:ABC transporter substrate-binding protein n=1 Tax=Hydrogenophaga sp. TaxID=1904254 RepID=UPI003D12EEAA
MHSIKGAPFFRIALAVALAAVSLSVGAEIRIGQVAAFSGPVAAGVKEITKGAQLYFDSVNAEGGINGQPIKLISVDDRFDPQRSHEGALELIEKQRVHALFLTRGTPHAQAIKPLLRKHQTPLIAPSTGAMVLHEPVDPWIFNVRATYQREAAKAIEHLVTIGITRIALLVTDDSFGEDALQGASRALQKARLEPVLVMKFPREKADFKRVGKTLADATPQAFLVIASARNTVAAIGSAREHGSRAQAVTLSNNASSGFIQELGDLGRGTIVTQVFPNERSVAFPFVKNALKRARELGVDELSPAMLEGYAAAMVLTEGIRLVGKDLTPVALRNALENMRNFNLGGLEVTYGANDHTGLDFVDLSIIDASGRFRR